MGILLKINLGWLMLVCSRLSEIDGEKLVGIHHDNGPLLNGVETAPGFDFCLTSSHCPHCCPPPPITVLLNLGHTLQSPGELEKLLMPGTHPQRFHGELGADRASEFFKNF